MAENDLADIQAFLQDSSSMIADTAPEDSETPEQNVDPQAVVQGSASMTAADPASEDPETPEQNVDPQAVLQNSASMTAADPTSEDPETPEPADVAYDPDLIVSMLRNCVGTGAKGEDVKVATNFVNGKQKKYIHDFFPQDVVENSKKKFFVLQDKMGGQQQSIHEFHRLHGYVNQNH